MLITRIANLKRGIDILAKKMRDMETKLDHYSRTDRLAYGIRYNWYQKWDRTCLKYMSELRELELEVPPPHEHLITEEEASRA